MFMYHDLGLWIALGLPVIIGVVTALVLALQAGAKKPGA